MNIYYRIIYVLTNVLARVFFRFRVVHRERLIHQGPVILAMNHQSYLDPPLAGSACHRDIFYLARKTLLDLPFFGWILPKLNVVPVEQEGSDRSALKALIRILREGNCALVFPEGSRTPDGTLQPALPGLGLVIAKTLAPVVPMRIFGARDAWPRHGRIHLFRPITIVVGEPIFFTAEEVKQGGKELYALLSERVMAAISALRLES